MGATAPPDERLGPLAADVHDALDELGRRDAQARMWITDHTLWQDDPTEVADRVGWLASPSEMADRVDGLVRFAAGARADGLRHAVVLGMGGSSLFPEVLGRTSSKESGLALHVLDTTDPAAVLRVGRELPLDRTLFLPASKSGTTVETTSALAHFWARAGDGSRFAAVTDPATPLASIARERGFRATFENRPDIGGRYSAISYFGLVPGALVGADLGALVGGARRMLEECGPAVRAVASPGARLGAVMAAAARAGRDKLTVSLPTEVAPFGAWLEQLVAESTGKRGTGLLPVVDEPLAAPGRYGDDRLFVCYGDAPELDALAGAGHPVVVLPAPDASQLGAEVVRWEVATALCGALLGINPFDQPDVAAAKEATSRVLRDGVPEVATEPLDAVLATAGRGDYVAIQAWVDPASPVVARLQRARVAIRDRLGVATTLGLGPRYLHSTGQFHKGGPPTGVFVQVVGDDPEDADIPGAPYGFSTLKRAQAAGDLEALKERGLRAARVPLGELTEVVP